MSENNLKKIRKLRNFTQQQLADELKVSKQMISMWENNPNEKIPNDRIKEIAYFLNVQEEDFYRSNLDEKKIEFITIRKQLLSLEEKINSTNDEEVQNELIEKSVRMSDRLFDIVSYDSIIDGTNKIFKDEHSKRLGKLTTISTFIDYLTEDNEGENLDRFNSFLIILDEENERKIKFLDFIIQYLIGMKSDKDYELDNVSKYLLLGKVSQKELNVINSLFQRIK